MRRHGFGVIAPSVQAKMRLIAAVGIVVTTVCLGSFILQARAGIISQVFQSQTALGKTYARVVNEYLSGSRQLVEEAAAQPDVRAPLNVSQMAPAIHGIPEDADPQRRAALLAAVQSTDRLAGILQIDRSGNSYLLEPFPRQLAFRRPPFTDSAEFWDVLATGQTRWAGVQLNGVNHTPSVFMIVPVKNADGQVESEVAAPLLLDGLQQEADAIRPGETGQVMLFDDRGLPVVYPDQQRVAQLSALTEQPLVAAALQGTVGSQAYYNPLTGTDELGTVVRLPENGWFAVVTQAQSEAFADLNRTILILIASSAISLVVLIAACLVLAQSIARALSAVARAATGIASGDLDQEVDISSNDDLGKMAAAFRDMVAYQRRIAAVADAVADGDLQAEIEPVSDHDRLGIALRTMIGNLRALVARLEERTADAEHAFSEMQVQVAERERAEKALEYQAFHDALSGLPNRALFTTRLERALEHAASGHSTIAVLFLDLDNFKFINDTLGHAAGDELLVIVAERLRACVRPGDTVARLGGDEFTILLEGSVTEDTAEDIARRASESLQQPVRLGGQDVVANVTIGIALDDGSRSPGDLLRAADVALYAGKASGKGRYVTHNSDMDSDAMRLHWAA